MSNNTELTNKVFKARKNLLEYLKNIDYNISDYNSFDLHNIGILVENEQLDMLLSDSKNKKIYVKFYIFKSNLRLNVINEMISDLYVLEEVLNPDDTLIIIIKDIPNTSTKDIQSQIYSNENKFINIFGLDTLQFNILEHTLVPKHTVLSNDEIKVVKETYNISDNNQFPTISRFDPPVIDINAKPGDIIKIERSCKNSISSNYYRLCINE
jgi:DNA-directed RNA polymerase subunit H (RpoH/RPB5)